MALKVREAGYAQSALLVRRTAFGIKPARIAELAGKKKSDAVEIVLAAPVDASKAPRSEKSKDTVQWWLEKIAAPQSGIQDRMAFFWHSLLPSHMYQVGKQELVASQLNLLRANALGNYRTLMQAMVIDGAMIRYLNAQSSTKDKPNENLARELMELFTVGVDHRYTEKDVRAAALAMTGWQVDNETFVVSKNPKRAHDGQVTFLGETKNWDVVSIVDRLCDDPATANRISAKIWFYLTGDRNNVPADLGSQWKADNLEIMPLLRRILNHSVFWENNYSRARSGFEYYAALAEVAGFDAKNIYRPGNVGQMPYQPPNVAGWQEGNEWLSLESTLRMGNASSAYDLKKLTEVPQTTDEILDQCGLYAFMEENLAVIEKPLPEDKINEIWATRLRWILVLNSPEFRKQ